MSNSNTKLAQVDRDWIVPTLQDQEAIKKGLTRTCIGLAFYRTHIMTFVKAKHELVIFDRRTGLAHPGPRIRAKPRLDDAVKPDYVGLVYSKEINCVFAISRMARSLVRFNFTKQQPEKETIADPALIAQEELTVICEVLVPKIPWCLAINSRRQLVTTSDSHGALSVFDENLNQIDTIEVPDAVAFTGICFDRYDDGYFVDRSSGCVYLLEYGTGKKVATPIVGVKHNGTQVDMKNKPGPNAPREWTGRTFEYGRTLHAICASRAGDIYVTCSSPDSAVYQISRVSGKPKTDPASYRVRAIVLSDFPKLRELNQSIYSLGLIMDDEFALYLSIYYAEKLVRIDSRYCFTFTKELMVFCLGWLDPNSVLRTELLLEIVVAIGTSYLMAGAAH